MLQDHTLLLYMCVCLCVCLSVCLSVCVSVCVSVCHFMHINFLALHIVTTLGRRLQIIGPCTLHTGILTDNYHLSIHNFTNLLLCLFRLLISSFSFVCLSFFLSLTMCIFAWSLYLVYKYWSVCGRSSCLFYAVTIVSADYFTPSFHASSVLLSWISS